MITSYVVQDGRLAVLDTSADPGVLARALWIDLLNPTAQEDGLVKRVAGIDIPTREEMQEIEVSSRLYREGEVLFLTGNFLYGMDAGVMGSSAITFALANNALVTVRYVTPKAFGAFTSRASKSAQSLETADGVLLGILEQVIDRIADILERVGADMDRASGSAFAAAQGTAKATEKGAALKDALIALGRVGETTSRATETLLGISRMVAFVQAEKAQAIRKENQPRIKTLARDLRSLTDHANYLSNKATFLLDATLGIINIEQTGIIKTFTVASVALMPPTLIASIYGMNFEAMPELGWKLGYPLALVLMVFSSILPVMFFKRKGWL